MPKIIDRDARRREIVQTYLDLVAREGMEQATTRRLAQELGIATGGLWHYFANFDAVLTQAFELVFERTSERIDAHVGDSTGLTALIRMIEQIHPLEKVTHDEAVIVVSFWGRTTAHRHGVRRTFAESRWQESYRGHLERAAADGELRADAPTATLANVLLVIALGQQVAYVLETPLASGESQWAAVHAVLDPWITTLGRERLGRERRGSD